MRKTMNEPPRVAEPGHTSGQWRRVATQQEKSSVSQKANRTTIEPIPVD
jgi:hypothetical protein